MKNPQTENGFVMVANEILEALALNHLSGNEWKIICVVLRMTWGFNKKEDKISISQFQKKTNLARNKTIEAISKLVTKRVLVKNEEEYINSFRFNKDYDSWLTSYEKGTGYEKGTKVVTKRELKLVTKKEPTINNIQDTKDICVFLDKFNSCFLKEYRSTPGRVKKLKERLKIRSLEEILKSVENLSKSEWHTGKNDRGWVADPDFLLRNDEQIDKWLNYQPKQITNWGGGFKI